MIVFGAALSVGRVLFFGVDPKKKDFHTAEVLIGSSGTFTLSTFAQGDGEHVWREVHQRGEAEDDPGRQ